MFGTFSEFMAHVNTHYNEVFGKNTYIGTAGTDAFDGWTREDYEGCLNDIRDVAEEVGRIGMFRMISALSIQTLITNIMGDNFSHDRWPDLDSKAAGLWDRIFTPKNKVDQEAVLDDDDRWGEEVGVYLVFNDLPAGG